MIISLNWLKKYVDIKIPTGELVELIGARLVEVEETIDLAPKYAGIKVVEVKSAEKIEGSDHLTKCMIWDGSVEYQVVCGAPNVKAGMLAVWLPPKTVLPATYDKEPLVLDKRKIRGVESAGMLAALDELDLGDDHEGIVEVDSAMARPGDDFSEVFGLNDVLLDIENKSLTHRPDCFGVIGFAREVAGILGQPAGNYLNNPDKNNSFKDLKFVDDVKLKVTVDDPRLCPRYQAVVLDGSHDNPAKYLTEMSVLLAKSGMRPVTPIVDVMNYLMLLSGQPLHAFDYDKLLSVGGKKEAHIIVRAAKKGEKLELLDGKTAVLDPGDIVVTSNNVPIALAGAMGCENTLVDANTRRIGIEAATFSLYNLRCTQFRHGIFSEAITRFTKGQPAGLTDPVINECARILTTEQGMKIVSLKVDTRPKPTKPIIVQVTTEQVNNLLGSEFTFDDIIMTLENVGFKAKLDGDIIKVTVPWWRTDIHIPEDVIEEVGRLSGLDNIPAVLPMRSFSSPTPDELGDLKSEIRQILSSAGANEVLTYSFVSEKLLNSVGQDPKNSYKIINSISPELQYVRQQILPSLFEKSYDNLRAGHDQFVLFEINQVFSKSAGLTKEKVPEQWDNLGFVIVDSKAGSNYFVAKEYVTKIATRLGLRVDFNQSEKPPKFATYFEPRRSADLYVAGERIGMVGEIKNSVADKFKLPYGTAAVEIGVDLLLPIVEHASGQSSCQKQSQFPEVNRDITFMVSADLEYAKLENLIHKNLTEQKLWFELAPVSIWQGDDKSTKNISFKLTFASYEKTLNGDEIAGIIDLITKSAKRELKAEVV